MVHKKTYANGILAFLLCLMMVIISPLNASAAVGVGTVWDGTFSINYYNPYLYMVNTRYYSIQGNDNTSRPWTGMIFESSDNVSIDINSKSTDVYIDGSVKFRVKIDIPQSLGNMTFNTMTPSCQPIIMDDLYVTVATVSRELGGTCIYDIVVEFDNYYVDNSTISIPLNIKHTVDALVNNETSYGAMETVYARVEIVNDYHGDVMQYDNLEDVPSLDGYYAEQNQTIIDQSQTQINNQQIQNQLQEQQNQLQNQGNQLQQESNEQNKNFMDNFFGNLGNTVLGWIVPNSEQITNFFTEVNNWFSDRLGFVWYPFDLAFQLVSAFAGGTANTTFKVPAFTLNFQGQQLTIWNPLDVDIDAFGIFQYVRFFTSTLLVCGIVKMAIDKWDEWIGGHNQ